MKIQAISLLLLASCIDGQGDTSDEANGAPSTQEAATSLALPVTTIQISTDVDPALLMVREGVAGAWRAATKVAANTYRARVRGPYTVAAVCPDLTAPNTQLTSRTPTEAPTLRIDCESAPTPTQMFRVSGTMLQPGAVSFANRQASSTNPSWSFALSTAARTYDLVAASADRIAVRRGLRLTANVTLPAIDLSQEGVLLSNSPFTVDNPPPGETPFAVVYLLTPGVSQAQVYRGPLATAKVAPSTVIGAGENQEVSVRSEVSDATHSILRFARRAIRAGGNSAFHFAHPFTGLRFGLASNGDAVVSWGGRLAVDGVALSVADDVGRFISLDVSGAYLDATGATRLPLTTSIPGYLPEWRIDTAGPYSRDVSWTSSLGATVPGEHWSELRTERVNQPVAASLAPVEHRASPWLRGELDQ